MTRRLLNLVTALSLLLCVAVVLLWVRSYWRHDGWDWGTSTGRAGVDSCRGYLSAGRVEVPPADLANIPRGHLVYSEPAARAEATMLKPNWSFGVIRASRIRERGLRAFDVRVPHWLVALAAAIAPGACLYRRWRPPPPGCCEACGYDLRATPGRCPECGTTTSPAEG